MLHAKHSSTPRASMRRASTHSSMPRRLTGFFWLPPQPPVSWLLSPRPTDAPPSLPGAAGKSPADLLADTVATPAAAAPAAPAVPAARASEPPVTVSSSARLMEVARCRPALRCSFSLNSCKRLELDREVVEVGGGWIGRWVDREVGGSGGGWIGRGHDSCVRTWLCKVEQQGRVSLRR